MLIIIRISMTDQALHQLLCHWQINTLKSSTSLSSHCTLLALNYHPFIHTKKSFSSSGQTHRELQYPKKEKDYFHCLPVFDCKTMNIKPITDNSYIC